MGYAGHEWLKRQVDCNISKLGKSVADFLGDVFKGLYHLPMSSLKKVDWANQYCIEYTYYGYLETVDFNLLTVLVVLAHDRMIRVQMQGIGPGYMRMTFHQRITREGSITERYPTIEDHVEIIRGHYGN